MREVAGAARIFVHLDVKMRSFWIGGKNEAVMGMTSAVFLVTVFWSARCWRVLLHFLSLRSAQLEATWSKGWDERHSQNSTWTENRTLNRGRQRSGEQL